MAFAGNNQPDLDGGSGGGSPSGGGNPGTPTGSSQGSAFPSTENGGVVGSSWLLFMPVQNIASGQCYIGIFDVSSFDDPTDGSFYQYRKEDLIPDTVPTVNRVDITYLDLGLATITVTVQAVNDDQKVVSQSVQVKLGNAVPTNDLMTKLVSIELTGIRPQLSWSRNAGSGPVTITRMIMRGEVEDDSQ